MSIIIANMVVRNEADAYLPQVLDRLQHQVDLICVTDDASTDNTFELLTSYDKLGAQQLDTPTFSVNEGQLRQWSWNWLEEHVREGGWDWRDVWVLAIDADEELYQTRGTLHELTEAKPWEVFDIEFYHMWNETQYRNDGGWKVHGSTRFFKYYPEGKFADRKLACGSEPTYVQDLIRHRRYAKNTGLKMKHLSYIKDEDKQKKYDRYMQLDGGAFHANAHILSIIDPPGVPQLEDWSFT